MNKTDDLKDLSHLLLTSFQLLETLLQEILVFFEEIAYFIAGTALYQILTEPVTALDQRNGLRQAACLHSERGEVSDSFAEPALR